MKKRHENIDLQMKSMSPDFMKVEVDRGSREWTFQVRPEALKAKLNEDVDVDVSDPDFGGTTVTVPKRSMMIQTMGNAMCVFFAGDEKETMDFYTPKYIDKKIHSMIPNCS